MNNVTWRDRYVQHRHIGRSGEQLNYVLMQPEKCAASELYPLVLFFHAVDECGSNNEHLLHGLKHFAKKEFFDKRPCYVLAAQCPLGEKWVDTPWELSAHKMPEKPTYLITETMQLLSQLQEQYPIDTRQIYATGLSIGGFATWDVIQRFPKKFAAAIPICGGGDATLAHTLVDIPLWVFHGDEDPDVMPLRSRAMVEAIQEHEGHKTRYTEYKGVEHNSWAPTYKNEDVHIWLFDQRLSR